MKSKPKIVMKNRCIVNTPSITSNSIKVNKPHKVVIIAERK